MRLRQDLGGGGQLLCLRRRRQQWFVLWWGWLQPLHSCCGCLRGGLNETGNVLTVF